MLDTDFASEVLETEIVVNHIADGHIYRFPIQSNGAVSLNGAQIEPNPKAKNPARRYLFGAHDAARVALKRAKSQKAQG
jgi:hypothetical protein